MENWFLLLIGAVIFIVQTVVNYNKEKAKNAERKLNKPTVPPQVPATKRMTSPQKTITSQTSRSKAPATKPTVMPEPRTSISSMQQAATAQSQQFQTESIYSESKTNVFDQISDEEVFQGNEISSQTERDFDLALDTPDNFKRAIIYTSIFERKY